MPLVLKHSTVLHSVSYNAAEKTLDVIFRSGKRYRYYDVSVQRYHRFINAKSHGRYYATLIRGRYKMRRLQTLAAWACIAVLGLLLPNMTQAQGSCPSGRCVMFNINKEVNHVL